jgi:hypothetical protein
MRVPIRAVDGHPARPTDRETIASIIIAIIARTRPAHTYPLSATTCSDEVTSADSEARISLGISRHHNSLRRARTSLHASLKRSSMEGHRPMRLVSDHRHRRFTALPSSIATIDPTSGEPAKTPGAASSAVT